MWKTIGNSHFGFLILPDAMLEEGTMYLHAHNWTAVSLAQSSHHKITTTKLWRYGPSPSPALFSRSLVLSVDAIDSLRAQEADLGFDVGLMNKGRLMKTRSVLRAALSLPLSHPLHLLASFLPPPPPSRSLPSMRSRSVTNLVMFYSLPTSYYFLHGMAFWGIAMLARWYTIL